MEPRKIEAAESPRAPEGAPRATGGDPGERVDRGRFSSPRKMEPVIRLLRGEDLDTLSRELGVRGATPGPGGPRVVRRFPPQGEGPFPDRVRLESTSHPSDAIRSEG